ncbi:MAG: glycosyltransferase family 39 protein [Vicinamibacterales bacterium]
MIRRADALLARRPGVVMAAVVVLAFVARLTARLAGGEADYRTGAYEFYRQIAQALGAGLGFCVEPGVHCAMRMPLYPAILAPFVAAGAEFPWLVVVQAACGAALVGVAWVLAHDLFGARAGLAAAVLTAVSPYAVVHDTAMQETVFVNLLIALSVPALLRARRGSDSDGGNTWGWLASGTLLALAVLATARVALLLPAAGLWSVFSARASWRVALRQSLLLALPAALILGAWVVRNNAVVGAPVLTTESGESFWAANNEQTFDFLPDRSIDLAATQSYESLSADVSARLEALDGREVERDRVLSALGWAYVVSHPGLVARRAVLKMWFAARGTLSPARGPVQSLGYAVFFVPVHLMAGLGLIRSWRRGWEYRLVPSLLGGFFVTTAIYWAHTSHKSVIDVFLFVYAAGALSWVDAWRRPAHTPVG